MSVPRPSRAIRPPQQARSRAALDRVLAAAEVVLTRDGFDAFTMASVADHAGLSVGAIYQRFAGKEELLKTVARGVMARISDTVTTRLGQPFETLSDVVNAYCEAVAEVYSAGSGTIAYLMRVNDDPLLRLADAVAGHLSNELVTAARPHLPPDPARPDADGEVPRSLVVVAETVLGAAFYRTTGHADPMDAASWSQWTEDMHRMSMAYLVPDAEHRSTG